MRPYFAMPYPGILRVTCETPMSGLPHVHVYMARGLEGGLVVFDTAMPYNDSFDRIVEGVAFAGHQMSDIERIYLTHAHPDHFGCAGLLQEATEAPVVCHPLARRALESMRTPDPDRYERMMNVYVEHGRASDPMIEGGMRTMFTSMTHAKDLVTIDEGDVLTFAGGDWNVYWTPGHEEGHVVFHRPRDGVLIVGDTVLGRITPHIGWPGGPSSDPDVDPDPLGQFLGSLEKVASLEPSLVLPGHGRPFDEGAERARAIASHHNLRLRRCMEIVMRKGPVVAMDVARDLFDRDLMFFEERLALAETLSHLEHLRLKGRLHREMIDGLWVYQVHSLIP